MRSKGIRHAYATASQTGVDATSQKKADKSLDNYAEARKSGIQPKSTRAGDVERAIRISDKTGTAYQA